MILLSVFLDFTKHNHKAEMDQHVVDLLISYSHCDERRQDATESRYLYLAVNRCLVLSRFMLQLAFWF